MKNMAQSCLSLPNKPRGESPIPFNLYRTIEMTHSTADGTIVRRKGNRGSRPNARKEWIVIRMDTYVGALKMWKPTMPMTIKQAADAFNHFSRWDEVAVKMITVKEWEAMQGEMA